jgi:hypothetical protein
MGNIIFQKSFNEQEQVTSLEIGGMLVLENSQQLKKDFMAVVDCLSHRVKITISNVEEIDLSFIQLLIAFIHYVNEAHVAYQFDWNIDEDQKSLLENVGLSNELFLNDSYV